MNARTPGPTVYEVTLNRERGDYTITEVVELEAFNELRALIVAERGTLANMRAKRDEAVAVLREMLTAFGGTSDRRCPGLLQHNALATARAFLRRKAKDFDPREALCGHLTSSDNCDFCDFCAEAHIDKAGAR